MNSLRGALRLLLALRSRSCCLRPLGPRCTASWDCGSVPIPRSQTPSFCHDFLWPCATLSASVCPQTLVDQTELELWAPLMLSEICSLLSLCSQTTAALPKTRLLPFYTLLCTVVPSAFPSNPAFFPQGPADSINKQTKTNTQISTAHSFMVQTKYGRFAVCWDALVNTD